MDEQYFEPFIGADYNASPCKTLLISESTYDWTGEDGRAYTPSPTHAVDSIPYHIEHFKQNQYFTAINRALTGTKHPTEEQMELVWRQFAYSVFVQKTIGSGARVRPSDHQWQEAAALFVPLLEKIRPSRVVVTGLDMWKRMPDTKIQLSGDVQAYELADGDSVWCLAVAHPANSTIGFRGTMSQHT